MYIISETLAGNDPRFHADMERIYSHWIYTSYYVPENIRHMVKPDNTDMVEVSEGVARAVKFGNVNAGKIGIRTGTLAHEEVFGESTEPDGQKTYYYITSDDEKNVVDALKIEMKLHLNKHYSRLTPEEHSKFSNKKQTIENEIAACETLVDCQKLMHVKFGLESLKGAQTDHNLGPATYDLSDPGRDNFQ